MQKVVFRRTLMAERQAARRLAKRKEENVKTWLKNNNEQVAQMKRAQSMLKKQARVWRREDYELGPLAPKRDVGDVKNTYGSIPAELSQGPSLYKPDRDEKLALWGGKYLNITTGDRVVLLQGPDKGKVGKISSIDKERAEVVVEGLNLAYIAIPEWMLGSEELQGKSTIAREIPVPMSAIRLVHAIRTTGEDGKSTLTDVIVKKLIHRDIWGRKHGRDATWERVIPDLNIVVPWPSGHARGRGGLEKRPEKKDTIADTLRIDVEEKTFIPTLFEPPMPLSIIDELRNKYSAFRTRHEVEYIQKKEAEEAAKKARLKEAKIMRTPKMDANRRARELRKAKGKGELTPEMLERIGRAIASKKQLSLEPKVEVKKEAAPLTA
ncbi:hypothetical protein HYFRA_00007736 [Hymenoscyphus fraxineus]|uniref:KOW domain-containing protein n=1 Tax=Hymenoscyphus fraxineus TaxID=746836 RepID=A0A9N9PK66_9HELO|nr:hypothetical protein HYFRA_00007736 [Hymenoscyphus fraxineus]